VRYKNALCFVANVIEISIFYGKKSQNFANNPQPKKAKQTGPKIAGSE
jgi:hypothetical protein